MFQWEQVKGRLIVSCQALPEEPLHSPFIMGRMAKAAEEGGAAGIRAQSMADILAIQEAVKLPIFGLVKRNYPDSDVYITPTMREVEELLAVNCEVIALDMTCRRRPRGADIRELVKRIHQGGRLVLADISTYEEGIQAVHDGADAISTTLSGYTPYSPQSDEPDIVLVERLVSELSVPVFAEGRIHTPKDVKRIMAAGAFAPIVGSAITRPQLITAGFVHALE